MSEIKIIKIGIVKNKFSEKADPLEMRKHKSKIIISNEYKEGLYRLNENSHILVVFGFNKSEGFELKQWNYFNEYKGVFATRSPRRPSQIATTVVRVTKIKNNTIEVFGLDAINDSPVL
ncbi:MAG: TrmO family methyltransferase domain-containing protein, partial [Nanoarchaeota archaeon]